MWAVDLEIELYISLSSLHLGISLLINSQLFTSDAHYIVILFDSTSCYKYTNDRKFLPITYFFTQWNERLCRHSIKALLC